MIDTLKVKAQSLKHAYGERRKYHVNKISEIRIKSKTDKSQELINELNEHKECRRVCDKKWSIINNMLIGRTPLTTESIEQLTREYMTS